LSCFYWWTSTSTLVIKLLHSNWPWLFHPTLTFTQKLEMQTADVINRHVIDLKGYLLIDYSHFTFFLLGVVTLLLCVLSPGPICRLSQLSANFFAVFLCRLRPWQRYTNYGVWIGGYRAKWPTTSSKQPESDVNPKYSAQFVPCRAAASFWPQVYQLQDVGH
jgi:hypothetical protein